MEVALKVDVEFLILILITSFLDIEAMSLYLPTSAQCRSSLALNMLTVVASTICCGSWFHSLTVLIEKKY
jgi:hypothetical protein